MQYEHKIGTFSVLRTIEQNWKQTKTKEIIIYESKSWS